MFKHLRYNLVDIKRVFAPGRYVGSFFDAEYAAKAEAYALSVAGISQQELVVNWLKPRRPRKILDFGCNSGYPLKHVCTALGCEGTGLDVNAAAIEKARRDNPDARFLPYDGNAIPLDDDSFDHVMLHHVLGHVDDPQDSIRQLVRVLRPGGTMSVITANAHYKLWQIPFNIVNDFLPDKTALRYYTARSLRHLLRRHELTVQSLFTHGASPSFCPSLARHKCGLFLVAFAVKPELGN